MAVISIKQEDTFLEPFDTANSSFAGGTSQPSTESMVIALRELGYDIDVNLEDCQIVADHFKAVKETFKESGVFNPKVLETDPNTLIYQVPGGMLSNLLSQLKEAKQLDKYEEVLAEVPRVRADMGYPPLVTPLSQMVGTQAVMNVLSGERYRIAKLYIPVADLFVPTGTEQNADDILPLFYKRRNIV